MKGKPFRVTAPAVASVGASSGTDRDKHLNVIAEATESQGLDQSLSMFEEDNVFSDPLNSVIDWVEGSPYFHQQDGGEKDDCSDEEYLPPICIRMGGALKTAPSIDRLPVIGIDETVHDQPAHEDPPDEPSPCDQAPVFPGPQHVLCEDDIIGARASIVYEDCLRQLATFLILPVNKCTGLLIETGGVCDCVSPFEINITSKGTATSVEWVCPNGHSVWRWNSQPVMKFGMQAGDFLLSTNILLSGSNYAKVALLFKFMNMGMVNKNTFFSIQDTFCVDTVKDFWEERRSEALSRLQGKDVVVLADGRNDSPGHCAQYCSYTTMENDTKEIIHVVTIDKRHTSWNSAVMEKEGFIETVDKLTSEIKLAEICTDAHAQIGALMNPDEGRYKALGIHHSLDMWHGAKNLAKKIAAAAKIRGQSILLIWLKDIVNHFWWCCKTAHTSEQFLALWVGILHHVCDIHTWTMGRCQHGHLEETRGKEWIQRDSKCHQALVDIVLNKRWLKDVHKYLRFRSTADLEVFQNHILMYASKCYAFSPPVYEARVLLAALDYNFHRNRPTMKTAEGKEIFRRLYKKNGRRYSVYALKSEKTYGYISELQARIVKRSITSGVGMPRRRTLRPDDPREFGLVPSIPAPGLVFPADVQQVLVIKEEVPSEWSPRLDQEDSEPLHIKQEQEELWTSQEGEQFNGLEEADITRFPFTAVPVKSEDDEEKPQSSQLHRSQTEDNREAEPPTSSSAMQIKTETDGEHCAGSKAARNLDPDINLQPNTDEKASDSSETEVSNDDWQEPLSDSGPETEVIDNDWKETRAPESGVNALEYKEAPVSDVGCNTGKKSFSCLKCGKGFHYKGSLQRHMICHLGKRSSSRLVNKKCFRVKQKVDSQMRVHTGPKPFRCGVCGKRFTEPGKLKTHMRVHTGEKPFGCDVCGKRFNQNTNLKTHMRVHTAEKPFGCDVCGKRFNQKKNVKTHMQVHTGEKPFHCGVCGKRFNQQTHLKIHMRVHTGEKPFGCDVCGKRFNQQPHLKTHMKVHSG
ncbi:uncharacterized protein LOC122867536 isoform X2 [Siniperca chuatsi]|nr:uncharacterized protein LOC122867536 isoform X2 [Siniperca chuatsi]